MVSKGDAFPRVTLPALTGEARALAGGGARVTLVVFGHADCGTTRLILPALDRLAAAGGSDVEVVCVLQEGPAAARELVDELSLQLPVLLDAAPYSVSAGLDLVTVPTLVGFGAEDVVTTVVEGHSRQELEALAESVGMTMPLFADDAGPEMRPG